MMLAFKDLLSPIVLNKIPDDCKCSGYQIFVC
jgi:hypothetical protein